MVNECSPNSRKVKQFSSESIKSSYFKSPLPFGEELKLDAKSPDHLETYSHASEDDDEDDVDY